MGSSPVSIKVARFKEKFHTRRADSVRRRLSNLEDRTSALALHSKKLNTRAAESRHRLKGLLAESSDYTEKMESLAHQHTVEIDGHHLKVLRILERIDLPLTPNSPDVDFETGLDQISPTTIQHTTNYHIEIVRNGRAINKVVDAGLTENLKNRVKGSGKYHWKDKVNRAVKRWHEVKSKYPSKVRIVFYGGNLSPFEMSDVEKTMTQLAKMLSPETLISGKNFSDKITTQMFPTWVIPGVSNLGAGTYLSETPDCLTTHERKMAKDIDRIYEYHPPK